MKIKVFTHGDLDGLGCGFLIKKYYEDIQDYTDADVEIQYVQYNNIDKSITRFITSGAIYYYDEVYITDISPSKSTCELIDSLEDFKFTLIDHHIGESTEHLKQFSWCNLIGEMDGEPRAATYLVAKHLDMLDTPYITNLVEHIDNWDTWKWKDKKDNRAKELNDLFYILNKDRFMDELLEQSDKLSFTFTEAHRLLLDIRNEEYERHLYVANKNMVRYQWKDYTVGVLFNDKFTSELGNDLCEQNDDIDFVALINFKTGISFRGVKEGIHLGNIAMEIGEQIGLRSGGHMKSAGCSIDNNIRNKTVLSLLKGSELWNIE